MPASDLLKQWLAQASIFERKELVKRSRIATSYFFRLVWGDRKASAEVAGRMEEAFAELSKGADDRLPTITRADLCEACAVCPYAIKCLKKKETE